MPNATHSEPHDALIRRVAPLCHAIRLCALAWITWATVTVFLAFASPAHVAETYGRFLKVDLSTLPFSAYVTAFAILLVDIAFSWAVVICIWRLFGHYLKGDIFSHAAVEELWRGGWMGVTATAADIVARPLLAYVLTSHLGDGHRHHFWIAPNDLLHLVFALLIVALAHIYRAGVEIAEENRQIV